MKFLYLFALLAGIIPNCLSADTFYVKDTGGSTDLDCGSSDKPCSNLTEAVNRTGEGKKSIIICGSYTIGDVPALNTRTFVFRSNGTANDIISFDNPTDANANNSFYINSTTSFSNLVCNINASTFNKQSVFYNNGSRVDFEGMTFNPSNETTVSTISGLIVSIKGELTITKCSFNYFNTTGDYSIVFCNDADLTLYDCSFFMCGHSGSTNISIDATNTNYGTGNAGGCIFHETSENGVSIKIGNPDKETSFKNCSADYGGAIYLSFKRNPKSILVTNVSFLNNKASVRTLNDKDGNPVDYSLGQNLFIDKVTTYLVNIENFPFFAGRGEDDTASMGNKDKQIIKLITFANKYKDSLYVGDEGVNTRDCNSTVELCQTLNKVKQYLNYARYIYICGDYTMTKSWDVDSTELTLTGYDENSVLYANGDCSFEITALKIDSLKIVFKKDFENLGSPYFLYVKQNGSLEITSCSFSVFSPDVKITDVIISLSEADLTIDSCSFTGINSKGTAGSVLSGDATTVFMYGCTFDECSCENGDGGVLNVNFKESLIFGRENYITSFKKNKATRGGAIFLHPEDCDNYVLTELTFGKGEEQNEATYGKNIFVISAKLNTTCNVARFPTLADEDDGGHFFEGVEDDGDDPRDIIDIMKGKYKEGPKMIYFSDDNDCNITDSDGENKTCGTGTGFATRIAYETSRVKYATVNITIGVSWTPKVDYDWVGNGYILYGKTHDSKIIISTFKFVIETDAEFRNLTMTLPPSFTGTIFNVTFGELVLYFVTVCPENGVNSRINGNLFYLQEFADSQFESVILVNITTTDQGDVLNATVGNGKQMKMTGVDYTNCITEGLYGGALYVDVLDGGYFYFIKSGSSISTVTGCQSQSKGGAIYMVLHESPLSVTFTDVVFGTEGVDLNVAPDGGANLYIVADQLEEALMTASFTISSDYGLMQRIVFEDLESELTYSLTDVFPDYSSNMYLSGEINESEVFCGAIETPCVSLNRAFKKSSGSRKELCILSNITHNEQLNCNKATTIIGLDNTSGIICGKDSEFVITTDLNTSVLIFTLKGTKQTLMKVTGCTLTATSLTFVPEEGVESVGINSPLISISDKGRGVITTCVFNGVTGNNINGTSINAMLSTSTSLYLKGCTFINCNVVGGNGGALYANVSDDASIIMQSDGTNPCTFKKCSAEKAVSEKSKFSLLSNEGEEGEGTAEEAAVETGRGGGFYLRFGSLPNYILVEDIVFGEGDEANSGDGRDFFIESVTIEEVITADHFPILSSLPKDYDGGKGISTGSTEAVDAKSLVKTDENNNLVMIIIISVAAAVVVIIVIAVIIICLKMKK